MLSLSLSHLKQSVPQPSRSVLQQFLDLHQVLGKTDPEEGLVVNFGGFVGEVVPKDHN